LAKQTLANGVELLTFHTESGMKVTLWDSSENLYKEPMSRLMYYSMPLESEYAIWLDDDSYVDPGWWQALRELLDQRVDYVGQDWWLTYRPGQTEMYQTRPWYRGVPFLVQEGKNGSRFMTGGFMAVRMSRLLEANYPDTDFVWKRETLQHDGGDSMLGEIARQLGWTRAVHSTGVHVNVDLEGKYPAPRRGFTGRMFGSDVEGSCQ
jgi:hypothetical protein